jgi:hypothetical protein
MHGTVISPVELVQVTRFGFWLAIGDDEHYLNFADFPWFKKATIEALSAVEEAAPGHLHWSLLDVDLDVESIVHPENFPLIDAGG